MQRADRWFLWSLAALAAAALAIRVRIGALEFMDFDEWQQVFMASAPRWKDLAYELHAEAHPPAFYLLLKSLLALGHGKLLYRSIAVIPGAASVVLIGLIARKLLRSTALALLCAAALALSAAAITVSIEVRQYQLTVFLLLLAFDAYLSMWTDEAPRDGVYLRYAIWAALGVLCHYSAVVFLGACAALAAARWMVDQRWRMPGLWKMAVSLASPLALFLYMYLTHGRRLPVLGYLFDFYWRQTPGETLVGFLSRNVQNFWNLFAPIETANRTAALTMAIGFAVVSAIVLIATRRRGDQSALPAMMAGVMVSELAVMSILRAYPFGGLLRHQYVVAPFLLLTAFVVLDRVASTLPPAVRAGVVAVTAVVLVGNLVSRWPALVSLPNAVAYTNQFDAYRAAFPEARAVYVDHWGVIGYYIHTDDRRRRFVRRIDDVFMIDQYHIDGPGGGVEIFYDKTRYILDFRYASLYRSLARAIRQSGVPEMTLFFFSPGDAPFRDSPEKLRRIIADTAAEEGLTARKIVVTDTTIFAGFQLKP